MLKLLPACLLIAASAGRGGAGTGPDSALRTFKRILVTIVVFLHYLW